MARGRPKKNDEMPMLGVSDDVSPFDDLIDIEDTDSNNSLNTAIDVLKELGEDSPVFNVIKELVVMDKIDISSMAKEVVDNVSNEVVPFRTDVGWTDYVLSHLSEREMDELGNPRVAGLVRLAEKFNGPIVNMDPTIVSAPSVDNNYRCVTVYRLVFDTNEGEKIFAGTADACPANIRGKDDSPFKNFQTTIAETRALGRAASRALGLCGVTSSEEFIEPVTTELINSTQINSIDAMCRRLNISVPKLIQWFKVDSINKIPRGRASVLLGKLGDYERGECETKDPKDGKVFKNKMDSIKGYQGGWRE